jgi:molybdate transport system ATP-binding protein
MLIVQLTKRRDEFILDVGFAAPTPGITALFGRSGCGKSTAIELIAGLLSPDAGKIQVDDDVLVDSTRGIDVAAHHRRVGVVFQNARLFPHLSVRGNLDYGAKRASRHLPRPVKFDDVVSLLGLESLLARRPRELSGGEQQRVALGRALLAQPRLLLLDEPLASLDAARREDVLPYLERLRDSFAIPIVYVSHQFDEVLRLASRVVLLEAGRAVADGDIATVSRHPALRAIVGPDAVGAVVSGMVERVDSTAQRGRGANRLDRARRRARRAGRARCRPHRHAAGAHHGARVAGAVTRQGYAGLGAHKSGLPARARVQRASALMTG